MREKKRQKRRHLRRWVYGSLLLLLAAFYLPGQLLLNLGSVLTLRSALVTDSLTPLAQQSLATAATWGRPQAHWLRSRLATWQGDQAATEAAERALLESGQRRLTLLRIVAAEDTTLAQLALARYPTATLALVWRADQLVASQPEAAIALYSQALQQNAIPYDWWLGLGKAYARLGDHERALAAYQEGCSRAWGVIPCHEIQELQQKIAAEKASK